MNKDILRLKKKLETAAKLKNGRPEAAVFPNRRRKSGAPLADDYQILEAKQWVDHNKL